MAGGRRPANFASSGGRHVPTDTQSSYYSIWQQPHLAATSPPSSQRAQPIPPVPQYINLQPAPPSHAPEHPVTSAAAVSAAATVAEAVVPTVASALATALEAAVSTAVSRALATVESGNGLSDGTSVLSSSHGMPVSSSSVHFPLVHGSESGAALDRDPLEEEQLRSVASSSFNHVVASSSPCESCENNVANMAALESRLEAERAFRQQEHDTFLKRLSRLEGRLESAEGMNVIGEEKRASLESRLGATEKMLKRTSSTVSSLEESMKSSQKLISDLRLQKRKAESDAERFRHRVLAVENQLESHVQLVESIPARIGTLEGDLAVLRKKQESVGKVAESGESALSCQLAKLAKSVDESGRNTAEASEAMAGVRSRMKRLESIVETEGKKIENTSTEVALQGGAMGGLRSLVSETSASVQGLKRLVETNLRSHSSAEGIVKDQAQLITRHVCVALRQFISRRITENNVLIDKTLRARVPAYADGSDEFVLVRESDHSEDMSPSGGSPRQSGSKPRESATVLPRDILDGAMGGDSQAISALMQ